MACGDWNYFCSYGSGNGRRASGLRIGFTEGENESQASNFTSRTQALPVLEEALEHNLQKEIVMDTIMVACETQGKWVEVQVNEQALKYGMTQTVNCPCGREQFVIGLRKRIINEEDFQKAKGEI
jgi:hypothetical protein